MADERMSSLEKKVKDSRDALYSDVYYNDNVSSQQIRSLKDRVNSAIEKISNNNIANTGESNISILYQKAYNINPSNGGNNYDLLNNINQSLSDRNNMNNVLAIYTQNTLVRDIDREIDMVCKYMPKLQDALDTRREHVLSADHFNKESIVIRSVTQNSSDDSSIANNIKTLKEKYDLSKLLDEDVYRPADKYGEAFVYIVPYKRAIETLIRAQYNGMGNTNADVAGHIAQEAFIESAVNDYVKDRTSEIDISEIIQEATMPVDNMSERHRAEQKAADLNNQLIKEACGDLKIEFNTSRIIKSAILDRMKTYKVFNENGSLFFNEKADSDISGTINKGTNEYTKATNDRNSMAANGVTLTNDINQPNTNKIGKIKIPGCVVKVLDHEMVKPLYIDNICLGYFYIECDKKMALEQTTYSSTIGGIRPSGAYKGTYDFHRNASSEYTAIKNIADAISKKIDAKFVNTNQDLSKEIYSILKYNASVDATGKIAKITVSFIPPEDIEHCYFEFDKETKRGISGLFRSLFPAKLFSSLYISNTLQSITRGFDKRVYYVRQTVDTNIAGTLMNVINQIQRSNFGIRQIESMSNVLNMIGRFNDIVIPRSASGDSPVDFEVIPGQQTEIKTELMNMLEEMAVNATDVPFEVVNARQQVDYATHLTMTNTKFLQKINNRQGITQKIFSRIITKIYNYEFNMDTDNVDELEVLLPPPIYLNAVNTGQIVDAVNSMATAIASAYVSEQNDPNLLTEFTRQLKMDMVGSLFPQDKIKRILDNSRIALSQHASSDEGGM